MWCKKPLAIAFPLDDDYFLPSAEPVASPDPSTRALDYGAWVLVFGVAFAIYHAIAGLVTYVEHGPDADPVLIFGFRLINIVIYLLLVARAGYRLMRDKPGSRYGLKLALAVLSLWGMFYVWVWFPSVSIQGFVTLFFVAVVVMFLNNDGDRRGDL